MAIVFHEHPHIAQQYMTNEVTKSAQEPFSSDTELLFRHVHQWNSKWKTSVAHKRRFFQPPTGTQISIDRSVLSSIPRNQTVRQSWENWRDTPTATGKTRTAHPVVLTFTLSQIPQGTVPSQAPTVVILQSGPPRYNYFHCNLPTGSMTNDQFDTLVNAALWVDV